MAPPNLPVNMINDVSLPDIIEEYFDLSDGKLSVRGVPLLDEVPNNVTFSPFNSICQPCDDVPLPLLNRVGALSHKGGFLGFKADVPSDRLKNSLGRSSDRDFLSIFRFKTWWSTMWVGNSGSNLQKETQWVLFDVPEIKSYVIIIPIIDGSFRSALQPGNDGHVVICAESGSTLLEEKSVPNLVEKFDWCTWDAFYLTVEPAGIWHGINEFTEAGVSPRFLIVDDGWQSISFDENEDPNEDAKNLPGATYLNAKITPCVLLPGLDGTMNDLAVDKVLEGGMGLVHLDYASLLYDSMHSYLSEVGVTGVKVDVIHILEYVSEEHGGRVELTKAYYKGLNDSLAKNFNGSGLISSMQQCNDFFFLGTKQISIGRAGDDFWFQDPSGDLMGVYWLQGVHMIHCSYNSMWMGQMIVPDWDMFQSDQLCAKYHAGSRAFCGGPVYLSDFVGSHDFDLIKKLVHPDGTVPNCLHCALPTRDCLFKNPLFDGKTALKIWNFNKFGGVIGGFNCQGAGWDPKEQRIKGFPDCYKPIHCSVHVSDIEWDQNLELAHMGKAEEYIVHLNQDDEPAF
ncbi:hypothetical protein DVH24_029312 [Malus domestica]|uniref:galactinol--sucrose galactosyltransferase n=1 Tax=Malus domestica TaxID=3750 RepID=A0A498HZM9_MALDO|nr:hypothetical protein DVH24_029312 [Malus domestica]